MCGIAGSFGKNLTEIEIQSCLDLLQHRGPDENFIWSKIDSTLLVTRLAIQDLASQHQPFISEDKNVICIFNGEIYNHAQWRQILEEKGHKFKTVAGDGEIIVHLYEEYNLECFDKLEGMFAICLIDVVKNQCILARDFFGIKPLYYSTKNGSLVFCSEINFFMGKNFEKLDEVSIQDFLHEGHMVAPRSILKDVNQVEPGTLIKFDLPSKIISKQIWAPKHDKTDIGKTSEVQAQQHLIRILEQSVRSQVPENMDFGCFLSGGIDSSLIAVIAASKSTRPIHTFSASFPEITEDGKRSDEKWSNYVSTLINSHHHITEITSQDIINNFENLVKAIGEPFSGVFTSFFLSAHASKYVKVCLTGDGADELFGGYINSRISSILDLPNSDFNPDVSNFISIPKDLYEEISKYKEEFERREILSNYFSEVVPRDISGIETRRKKEVQLMINKRIISSGYPENSKFRASLAWDLFHTLPNNVLFYADRLSMFSSLEIRPPFLNRDLFNFVMQIPDQYLIDERVTKRILKNVSLQYFPKEMVFRKKEGFIAPVDYWLRNQLREWAQQQLDDRDSRFEKFVHNNYLNRLMLKLTNNQGDYRLTRELWALLVFNQWLKLHKNISFD